MSSLPWICAVTLTLLSCLTAQPVKSYRSLMIDKFNTTIANHPCLKETENQLFYSPVDVKGSCEYSALDCYFKELKVLVAECDAKNEIAADNLMTTLEAIKEEGSFCSNYICEVSPQKPFKEFLENMETLVQQINSLPSKSRR